PGRPDPLRVQRHGRRRLPARRRRHPHGPPRRREHHRGSPGMTARIAVGYTATDAGGDAVALGARLAVASDSALDLVVVLPGEERSVITPPDAGYDRYLQERAEAWLADAAAAVPHAIAVSTHVRFGESFAAGLIEAAHEVGATHIVVGAANGGLRGRHRLGT